MITRHIESIDIFKFHHWVLVKMSSDDGTVGWGQTGNWEYPETVESALHDLRPLLIGEDPRRIEHHWHRMHQSRPGRGAAFSGAVAALDIAMWDLTARQLGVPVYQLLGGKQRDRVRLHLIITTMGSDDQLVEAAVEATEDGFTAVKIDPIPPGIEREGYARTMNEGLRRVAKVREAVGPDVDIIVELHRRLTTGEAIAFINELAHFRVYFCEDPVAVDGIEAHREVSTRTTVPIGVGERHYSLYEFRDLIGAASIRFVRPDVGVAGGFTGCRKIAALAEAFHSQVVSHNFFSPLLTAATVQLYAGIPNAGTLEYMTGPIEEAPSPLLLNPKLTREGGYLVVPDGPGLGVEVDEAAFSSFPEFSPWSRHPKSRA